MYYNAYKNVKGKKGRRVNVLISILQKISA